MAEKKMDSKRCAGCGAPLPDEAKHCGACGRKADGKPAAPEGEAKVKRAVPPADMLGLKKEFAGLTDPARAALNQQGSFFQIHGPSGCGKTRFLEAAADYFQESGFKVLRLEGDPESAYFTLQPFRKLIARLIGISDKAERILLADLQTGLRDTGLRGIDLYYLGLLFPMDIPQTTNERLDTGLRMIGLRAAVLHLLEKLCRRQPVFLLVDHTDWMDSVTLKVLHALIQFTPEWPMAVFLAGRKPFLDPASLPAPQTIEIPPMEAKNVVTLARTHLDEKSLPGGLESKLPEAVDGNPLALKFLLDYLRVANYLQRKGKSLAINTNLRGFNFPKTPEAIVGQMMELFKPHIVELAHWVTALCPNCSYRALNALYPHSQFLEEDLKELVEYGIIKSEFRGATKRVEFTHNYLYEYFLAKVPSVTLAAMHTKIGNYFQKADSLVLYTKPWTVIRHRCLGSDQSGRKVHGFERSGQALSRQLQIHLASLCFQRECQILRRLANAEPKKPNIHERKLIFALDKLCQCHAAAGDYDRAEKSYRLLNGLVNPAETGYQAVDTLFGLADLYKQQNRYSEAKQSLERALHLAQDKRDPYPLSLAEMRLGDWFRSQGKYEEAESHLEEARMLAAEVEDNIHPTRRWSPEILFAIGKLRIAQERLDEALSFLIDAMEGCMAGRNAATLVRIVERLAILYGHRKQVDRALGFVEYGLQIARAIGDPLSIATITLHMGRLMQMKNEPETAVLAYADAYRISREIDWKPGLERSRKALFGMGAIRE